MERKEVFGRIFRAYIRICGSPQREHRLEAVKDMKAALSELEQMGVSFEELAQQESIQTADHDHRRRNGTFCRFCRRIQENGNGRRRGGSEPFKERAGEDRSLGQGACCTADRCRSTGTVEPSQLYRCAV